MKNITIFILSAVIVVLLAAIGLDKANPFETKQEAVQSAKQLGTVEIGATSGPYADMVKEAIVPGLEKKGYTVKVIEYSDYIQPNKALEKGDLDANLYQHRVFTKLFNQQNKTHLTPTIQVPTAPMGIYSGKYHSFAQVTDGSEIAVPNDPVNAARAFNTLQAAGIIKVDKKADPLTVSERDITSNPKHLKFVAVEAAQLPRSADSIGLSAVPGNYALASKMKLSSALQLEKMTPDYRNRIVVRTKDKNSQLTKAIAEVIKSKAFNRVIDQSFKGFDKPNY